MESDIGKTNQDAGKIKSSDMIKKMKYVQTKS